VIFQDPSLEDMAIQYPINMEELQHIQGVGSGKAQRYGQRFVALIKTYVDEKEIIRAQDMVVKSVVNKSGLKVYIIQNIDRKVSLDDIANAKNLEMPKLLDEIEAIINSGTKLNLDYYINEVLDEDHQDEVFDYFREAESESVSEAMDELGEDEYTVEDIRLMRIKFMAELGL
jgi:ATP-dependent DNA helicase RecQ